MNLCFVIASLQRGGAERALSHVANGLAERGHDVSVVTLAARGDDEFPLMNRIRRSALGVTGDTHGAVAKVSAVLRRLRALRGALRTARADCVVVFGDQTNVLALLATLGLGVPVVISERTHPQAHVLPAVWRWLRARLYPRARHLVVQTRGLQQAFRRIAAVPSSVIPNPIHLPSPVEAAAGDGQRIVGLGRLAREKGFDVLVEAMPRIREACPRATLTVHGEGPERARLEARAAELGVPVALPGFATDVTGALADADLFVLPSRYEGQPNAMLEAMAHQVPVVACDGPGGVREVAGDGAHARLVPADDADALAAAVVDVLADRKERQRLAEAGARAVQPFSAERVFDAWEALLAATSSGGAIGADGDYTRPAS